jgi:hypothetical protein
MTGWIASSCVVPGSALSELIENYIWLLDIAERFHKGTEP